MDDVIRVSLCDRRTNRRYKNQEKTWAWIADRNRKPIRTTETVAEYPRLSKERREEAKDHGGFVGGWLREGCRKNGNVLCRGIGTLDADNLTAEDDFRAKVRHVLPGVDWFIYSTHSHTPEAPRYRLVIRLSREVSEDEYPALMRQVAKDIGMDFFDDSTYQANRMMYWASCPADGQFVFDESAGQPLNADAYLGRYENWKDTSQWPLSSRESEVIRRSAETQQDPLNKDGIVGTFCRTFFPIQSAMETFLSDIYAPTTTDNRWDYIPAESTSGVVIYGDRFAYSHHTTDPACGRLLNAFDLVRIHRFGEDEKSFRKMAAFAMDQEDVRLRLDQERMDRARADFAAAPGEGSLVQGYSPPDSPDRSWTKHLTYQSRTGEVEPTYENLILIFRNDPDYANFAMNQMAHRIQVTGPVPWERPEGEPFWRDADTSQLSVHVFCRYTVFSARTFDHAFSKIVDDRRFHPVRDYLNSLPPWDGECRIETLLCRCLLAEDSPYVRAVTRKVFAGAVARIYQPGIKFDSMLVLDGPQGIGKSTLFRELAGADYYSETLSLTDMSDKSGAEKLQGYWIIEIEELAGMKKADIERVKAFLSTTDDTYRPSYGRVVESHRRQCIIIATVNGERGYLRDITGNRRYWVVRCTQTEQKKRFSFTPEERDQIWAEARHIWESGEKLYLEGGLLKDAEEIQRGAMEEDDRQGMVEQYLETLLPVSWPDMDLYARRAWLRNMNDPTREKGAVRRETVTNAEIWAECLGNDPGAMKSPDSYGIMAIMTRLGGWEKTGLRQRIPLYGQQRFYRRTETADPRQPAHHSPLSPVTAETDNFPFSGKSSVPDPELLPQPVTTGTDKTVFSSEISASVSEPRFSVTDETAKEVNFYDFLL